ncbi:MAG: plasmid mobilization relaxosome protein MobC [Hyphomicrobiales bacterium]|nr:plasmid mobilization relaxosome protein MobC [Hyphomicrobiales bacterium]
MPLKRRGGFITAMPAPGHRKPDSLCRRIRVQLSDVEQRRLAAAAKDAGVSQSAYVRALIASATTGAKHPTPPRSKRTAEKLEIAEVHQLAMQVKRLGTNVNQMAKQANEGLVPLRRAEVEDILKRHERLLTAAILYFERVL